MTEAQWLACDDPVKLLDAPEVRDRAAGRRLLLFYAACCRSVWDRIPDSRFRELVELTERFADGEVKREAFHKLYHETAKALRDALYQTRADAEHRRRTDVAEAVHRLCYPSSDLRMLPVVRDLRGRGKAAAGERRKQAGLARDIFGNPFRAVTPDPAWLTSTVLALAGRMYESRDFSAMPILADALQDAGCEHPDVLAHCQGAGPHVRGCWVVDLVLGKT